MPCETSASFFNMIVFGSAVTLNLAADCTAKPSQWPDARAWLTICAQAAASAIG
jgi:hypothetical protein